MSLTCVYCNITLSRSDKIKPHNESETHKLNVIIFNQNEKIKKYEQMLNKFREILGEPIIETTQQEITGCFKKRGRKASKTTESKNIDFSEECLIE